MALSTLDTRMHRCPWGATDDALMNAYHDAEWGTPRHGDDALFEFLCLEGAQAGLSWRTVLHKRAHYREVFHGFAIPRVATMGDAELAVLLDDPGIIRNRLKVSAMRDNARAALALDDGLDAYLWSFVAGVPVVNHWRTPAEVPASTPLSDRLSKDLKKRGFRFVGTTICYALMQATGMVDDHLVTCFRHAPAH